MILCVGFNIETHAQSSHWQFDAHAYRYDMTAYVFLSIDGEMVSDYSDYEIAAFCGEECRGIATIQKVEKDGTENAYGYLRVRSNQDTGEAITFKVFKVSTNQEMNVYNTSVTFSSQQVVGMPSSPMLLPIIHYSVSVSCDETMGSVSGGGVYEAGATATLTATPIEGYHFVGWSDGEEANPYEFTVTGDISLSASFAPSQYTLGDVNGNKKVEVADFIATANYILGNPPQVFIFKAGDLNNNKNIEVSDFIGIANIILNSSVSSNAPAAAPRKGPRKGPRKAATDVSTLADAIYVEPVTAAPGTQQVLSIQMKNSNPVAGFEFRLQLPDGITVATDEDNILMAELSTARTTARKTDYFGSAIQSDGTLKVLCGTSTADPKTGRTYTFSGNEGEVALITINIPDGYAEGVYEVGILDARFSDDYANLTEVNQTVTSELTIGDNSIVLDENDTAVPSATTGNVNIVVKRTIVANRWNTICLPFNMTEAQVYAAFGNDVQLQEFDSYDASYDDSDNVTGILVHFLDTDMSEGIYANYPYLIKTSHDISQFTVNSTIDPDEEGAVAEYDNGKSGRQRKVWGSFIGTYHAQTTVPENGLFLNENKFWYSDGTTKMKAFRAYFMFDDVLSSMDSASAKISMVLDGETTGVHVLDREQFSDGAVYTIQGQLVGRDIDMKRLPSGVYIVNGKKIVKQ